ncbi:MAG: hypothetical protein LUO95_08990 [Methylococcaceae bacterium]|nr:hypothetical protein [Methylococcaceae bacterium]MDD1616150.1 hypothetical protein [Methylococcaceae bacterium]OYV18466.1 MAG: hypothetical protein CG439_1273 [Methylococcaceae bacterium NSP1-2]
MNSKLIKTLMLVCLVLLLVITLEWLYAEQAQQQMLSAISSETKPVLNDEMPQINLNSQPEDSYADLVNRPLFISGRKPIAEAEKTPEQVAVVTNTFDWMLNGIYTTKKGLMALLTRTVAKTPEPAPPGVATTKPSSSDKYRKVITGDTIEGWKVAEIHPYEIMLTQGDTQKNLPLRKPKPKAIQGQNAVIPPNLRATPTATPRPTNDSSEDDTNANN